MFSGVFFFHNIYSFQGQYFEKKIKFYEIHFEMNQNYYFWLLSLKRLMIASRRSWILIMGQLRPYTQLFPRVARGNKLFAYAVLNWIFFNYLTLFFTYNVIRYFKWILFKASTYLSVKLTVRCSSSFVSFLSEKTSSFSNRNLATILMILSR